MFNYAKFLRNYLNLHQFSSRLLSEFQSAQNLTKLYPNSDPNAILRKPDVPKVEPSFNGYIPIETRNYLDLTCSPKYETEDELHISYSCSSGPGGQHVNKNKTKVEIRFHVPSATWLTEDLKKKFMEKEANRLTKDNYFVILSDKTRKQILNQADCLERIRRIVRECVDCLNKPEPDPETLELIQSRKVKANENRLREKKLQSFNKKQRRICPTLDDM